MEFKYTDDPFDPTFADETAQHMLFDKGLPPEYHDMARDTCRWLAQILSKRDKAMKASYDWGESMSWHVEALREALDEGTETNAQLRVELIDERAKQRFWYLACCFNGFVAVATIIYALLMVPR